MTIKFNLHAVTNGTESARVFYSRSTNRDGAVTVTLYAKDFEGGDALREMFGSDVYVNNTDTQSDIFDKGHVTLTAEHPLFAEACTAAERTRVKAKRTTTKHAVEIESDKVDGGKYPTRVVLARCGKVQVSVCCTKYGVSISIVGKTPRRSMGKHFRSLAVAVNEYRSPEMKAILTAVAAIKPRMYVRASETAVSA